MTTKRVLKTLVVTTFGIVLGFIGPKAIAQNFPDRPITIVVPVPPGGLVDASARLLSEPLARVIGQSIVIDNRQGASGNIAYQYVARSKPDGYTLLASYSGYHAANPLLMDKLNWDPFKDFTPIGMIGATPNVLVINNQVPAKNMKEFIDYVRKHPGKLSYGTAGQGSLTHMTMELFKQETGLFILHIPYRGISPAFTDLLGGQPQAMFPGLAAALQYIQSGKVRALAVTGPKRSSVLKDVPTMEELGFKGFDAMQWYGTVGPAGIPADIVKRLNETQVATLKLPEMREKLAIEAVEPMPMTPEQFGQFIKNEVRRWTALANARNIQLDE